jgi:hypothetical protein
MTGCLCLASSRTYHVIIRGITTPDSQVFDLTSAHEHTWNTNKASSILLPNQYYGLF